MKRDAWIGPIFVPIATPLIWSKNSPANSKEFKIRTNSVSRTRVSVLMEGEMRVFRKYLTALRSSAWGIEV